MEVIQIPIRPMTSEVSLSPPSFVSDKRISDATDVAQKANNVTAFVFGNRRAIKSAQVRWLLSMGARPKAMTHAAKRSIITHHEGNIGFAQRSITAGKSASHIQRIEAVLKKSMEPRA